MRLKAWLAAGTWALCTLWSNWGLAADPLEIDVREIERFDRNVPDNRFGALTFLGGLVLESDDARFKGLSGLDSIPEGEGERLLIVSDDGYWITATLNTDANEAPLSLSQAQIGTLTDQTGQPLEDKRLADAEAITRVDDMVWVAFERNQPIRAYSLDGDQPSGRAVHPIGAAPPLDGRWNQSAEAIVHVTQGPLTGETLLFLESPPRSAAAPTAARILPDGSLMPFAVQRQDRFSITGAAMLPGGDIIVLERRFAWTEGLFVRLRLLTASDILSGAVQGRLLMHADETRQIDNLEGIAITEHPDGPIVTLISDDNGNFFQRTLLLRFQLTGDVSRLETPTLPNPVARPAL
ncbi:MAG: esterase-like activity of phytase family protein [Pseudomonadota bacterium]